MKILSNFRICTIGIALVAILGSCAEDQSYDFPPSVEKPVISPTGGTEFTVIEGETVNIPFTTSRAVSEPMTFKFIIVDPEGATATMSSDYTVGEGPIGSSEGNPETMFRATIPAYSESFEIPFSALEDLILEGAETVQLRMEAVDVRTALTPDGGILFTFNIEQVVSDKLVVNLAWPGTYIGTDGETYDFSGYDLDILLYNDSGTALVNVDGATAETPEQMTIVPGDLADGDYLLVLDYWAPADVPVDTSVAENPESIPAILTLVKPGIFNEVIDLSGTWTNFANGSDGGNPNATVLFATINIQGSTYTITNLDTGEVIAQGRSSSAL